MTILEILGCLGSSVKTYLDVSFSKWQTWSLDYFYCKCLAKERIFYWKAMWNHDHPQWNNWHDLNRAQKLNRAYKLAYGDNCRMIPYSYSLKMQLHGLEATQRKWKCSKKQFYNYATKDLYDIVRTTLNLFYNWPKGGEWAILKHIGYWWASPFKNTNLPSNT